MATEEYSIGYSEGYQEGWNAAMDSTPPAARPAPVQPVAWAVVGEGEWGEWVIGQQFETNNPPNHEYWENRGYLLVPLYTTPPAQPAPVQEPVARQDCSTCKHNEWPFGACEGCSEFVNWEPTDTTPPAAKRQWVGLTDDEWDEFSDKYGMIIFGGLKQEIEAKLKEKNNG